MKNKKRIFRIFLCGDVMTGRGIDQILSHPSSAKLYEGYVKDAREYVQLAEEVNGKIPYPAQDDYIWGDALEAWKYFQPDLKIANLETSITVSNEYWPDKGINYRMHPKNIGVLSTADFDICTLSNNHILDWGYSGLHETLMTLNQKKILVAGAGENISEAMQPAIFNISSHKRVLVFSSSSETAGVFHSWSASNNKPGLYFLSDFSADTIEAIAANIKSYEKEGDLIIFSIHWGSNWGYHVPNYFRDFAQGLIDTDSVDIIYGHSSHHPRPIEIYKEKLIMYGCGDFINDYEGIAGYEQFRNDLTFMYFLDFDIESSKLLQIMLIPLQIKNFRLHFANQKDVLFLLEILDQFSSFGVKFHLEPATISPRGGHLIMGSHLEL